MIAVIAPPVPCSIRCGRTHGQRLGPARAAVQGPDRRRRGPGRISWPANREDRLAEIKQAWRQEGTSAADRRGLAAESLRLQEELRVTVQAKREAIDGFLADLDVRISRTRDLLGQMNAPAGSAP